MNIHVLVDDKIIKIRNAYIQFLPDQEMGYDGLGRPTIYQGLHSYRLSGNVALRSLEAIASCDFFEVADIKFRVMEYDKLNRFIRAESI